MSLPANFLDEVRARTPLPSLVGRRVRLARNGRQWKGCCPFHNERTPSFYCYDDHYHCFGCGAHGDAIRFVMETEGAAFREAVERLAAEAGLEVPKESPRAVEREQRARDLHDVLELACDAMRRRLRTPEGRPALDYLRRRGLSDETIARFGLGWSGGGRGALAAELSPLGVEPARLVEAGLCKVSERGEGTSDFFFNRVMFPIRDRRGRIVSFGGRVLGDGQPKYLNGPETELFSKRRTLYGLDLAREAVFRGARLLVVEGYMDVIALHQAGFGGAVAPLGTALTAEQLAELWRVSPEPVLSFDRDAAGTRAALRTAEMALPLLGAERSLRLLALPGDSKDPDEFLASQGAPAFAAALDASMPLSEALFDLLAPRPLPVAAEGWASLRRKLEEWAATIRDRALAGEFRRSLLDRFFAARNGNRPAFAPGRGAGPGRGASGRFPPRAPPVRVERRAIVPETARLEQARCLLAITLAHPWILDEVEEACALLDLPEGQCQRVRAGMLAWHSAQSEGSHSLDSVSLAAHLREGELRELFSWVTSAPGYPAEARPEAQPADALRAWWHFYAFLRGEASLIEDKRSAERDWVATNDPVAEQRLRRLSEALLAVRCGEAGEDDT